MFIYKILGGIKNLNPETYWATGLGDALWSAVPFGGGEVENTALSLLNQGFKREDARHIFQALALHSDYFLTLDEKSILKRYRENYLNMKIFCQNGNLRIVNQIELATELGL